jgi:hypothetical protein
MRRLSLLSLLLFACGPGDGPGGAGGGGGGGGATSEVCGNGLDDDGNGMPDDGCGCTLGQTQACWPGDPADRNRGECRDGVQECTGQDEFTQWGPCHDGVAPSDDIGVDGRDQDCDGDDGDENGTSGCALEEICDDGNDNDCDSMPDCLDPDCATEPLCAFGGTCFPFPIPESCAGAWDEDCDGLTDCADSDCAGDYDCSCMEVCTPGAVRWCDTPSACNWGRQPCNPDGTWGACTETSSRPTGCESSGPAYDKACCVAAPNACCQDYPDNYASVGECAGIAMCTGP